MNSFLKKLILAPLVTVVLLLPFNLVVAGLPDECLAKNPDWIWCDDFESDVPLSSNYFDVDLDGGDVHITSEQSFSGLRSLSSEWSKGEVDAGHLLKLFGSNPLKKLESNENYREIYWRFYLRMAEGFEGYADKVSRATIFATPGWQQALIAHLWFDQHNPGRLLLDPSTGIDRTTNQLITKSFNDIAHLKWLGIGPGKTKLDAGRWYCIEAHVKLNSSGTSDGLFEFWLNDSLEAKRENLNWLGTWNDFGLNAVMLSNYWNAGSPKTQKRFIDSFIISRSKIGCRANPQRNES